ncbi:relaxin-3 precursor [Ornithorhynchus anatinus]|uniref:Relaxin-3 n=1 Tax=Ornithorhynchus anatinus TaxID=9258 RepID=B1AAQ1_ORNAN|nr:relaxin-3 precursor [Ornithorhynchus anatinus]ACA13579.1 relaxin family locus C type I [Ornithorhynchus anatinus]
MPKLGLILTLWVLVWDLRTAAEARSPSYGMKLCGREFIRAVIFTCGGSRWRRAGILSAGKKGNGLEKGRFPGDALVDTMGSESDEATSSEWHSGPGELAAKELNNFYTSRSWQGVPWSQPGQEPETSRGGRDVLAGLSSNCCKWGCSKSEISSLC